MLELFGGDGEKTSGIIVNRAGGNFVSQISLGSQKKQSGAYEVEVSLPSSITFSIVTHRYQEPQWQKH